MEAINGVVRTGNDAFDEPGKDPLGEDQPGEIVSALLQATVVVRLKLGEFLERYELTEARHAVLVALDQSGARGLSQSEVADRLKQSESNISTLIDRLQRDGLVDRRWSDTDRRKRVLLLTADGQQLHQRVELARRRWAESLLSDVAPFDRRVLSRGLSQLLGRTKAPQSSSSRVDSPAISAVATLPDDGGPHWPSHMVIADHDPNSPHFALERMLSSLGLASQLAEDEQ